MSDYLARYYGKKAIILLDEYDTPMQEAYVNGYWDESVSFIRSLFNSSFKTNPYLERAIMTGITRVSKESIFSDLNNLEVVTTTSEKYQDSFGFTQKEVSEALKEHGLAYNEFVKALLRGDVKGMNAYMNKVALETFSYFDTGRKPSETSEPEKLPTGKATTKSLTEPNSSVCFYHGFVLGLIVELADRYTVTSNRESGYGRYDVMLESLHKGDDAMILEFKVYDPEEEETLQDTVKSALAQIEDRQYATALTAKGIILERIRRYGFAFEGKKVLIGS